MGKHLLILLSIHVTCLHVIQSIPLNGYDDHVVVLKESHVDDDGHYVQVASVVEAQEPAPAHRPLNRADFGILHDEDEDEETTVRGPGYQGILAGLSGIFSNVVNGNLGKVVESTFNFVPPVYQGNVQGVYNSLLGKPPLTTSTAEPESAPESAPVEPAPVPHKGVTSTAVPASAAAAAVAGVTAGPAAPAAGPTQKTALQAAIAASSASDEDEDDDGRKLHL